MGGMYSSHMSHFSGSFSGEWIFCEAAILPWPIVKLLNLSLYTELFKYLFFKLLHFTEWQKLQKAKNEISLPVFKPNAICIKNLGFIIHDVLLNFYASGCAALAEDEK